jgi:enamine deaminase RidA (YjgF/YER057c/UK114 family)
MQIERMGKGPRMSQAVIHNGVVYLSGQVANDTTKDMAGQTQEVLDKVDALLKDAGSSAARILSATIWISDYARFNEMNEVWDRWVDKDHPPARACVEAKLAYPQYIVEIGVVAARD